MQDFMIISISIMARARQIILYINKKIVRLGYAIKSNWRSNQASTC